MKKSGKKTIRILSIILIIIGVITGSGFLFIKYLESEIKSRISGCELKSKNFYTTIDFDYVNNWIIVYAGVGDSEKKYPFIFDTGAQTVFLDSLLNETESVEYMRFNDSKDKSKKENAFNNEIVTLGELNIGDVSFANIGSLSARNSQWEMLNCISPYGIIGCNIIKQCVFQINYMSRQMIITDDVESLPNFSQIRWIPYKPTSTQESPVVEAKINDSIHIKLLFDTGMSGGIKISSEKLTDYFNTNFHDNVINCFYSPSLKIRGEKDEILTSLKTEVQSFILGDNKTTNQEITVKNSSGRDFDGIIGNKYFQDYIITLDLRNRRIGFINQDSGKSSDSNTFGISYIAKENKVVVSSVYEGFMPKEAGINPGDEIYSINGIIINTLEPGQFCEIYRSNYHFTNPEDTILTMEFVKNDSIISYRFQKVRKY